jgi:spoIIIJ-associated protein
VQWVETTGRTVDDAKEAALDQLGIDEREAEFEIVEEPRTGLFGRPRSEARIRARVIPKTPRPKQERRPRGQRAGKGESARTDAKGASVRAGTSKGSGEQGGSQPADRTDDGTAVAAEGRGSGSSNRRPRNQRNPAGLSSGSRASNQEGNEMNAESVSVDQQADIISEFLEGLLGALGVEGDIDRTTIDDDTIELGVEGGDLGLLIGPKGQTLTAVHELSRTVLQRRATGRHDGRVRVDIGGYRQRRQEALARFVRQQSEEVIAQGVARAMEPMNAVDRKVVHDTVNEIDGISTLSEGVDPNRCVVIVPEGAEG